VKGLPEGSVVTASSLDGLSFVGQDSRLNVRAMVNEGVLEGEVKATFNRSSDTKTFELTILPAYPEISIARFENESANIFTIAGVVNNASTLGIATEYKILACLHTDVFYCQELAPLQVDGSFEKTGHNFYGGFPFADRVQFVLVHNSITPDDNAGVFDSFSETQTRYIVWKEMDGANIINFKNHHLSSAGTHANIQIQNLITRFGKFEETAQRPMPASPARFVRSFLDIDQFYLYDQALAVFAFTRASEAGHAKTVLNALKNHWEAHGNAGWWYFSYNHDGSGSSYPMEGDRRMAGAIAWVAMSINYYKIMNPSDTDYDVMAKAVMEYLRNETRSISVNGLNGKALRFGPSNYSPTVWDESDTTSLEHNLDFYAALGSFATAFPADSDLAAYSSLRTEVKTFIDSLWITSQNRFYPGAVFSTNLPNADEVYLDTQSWGVLALGSSYQKGLASNCELFVEKAGYFQGGGAGITGFFDYRPSNLEPNHRFVWSEGTAGQILALAAVEAEQGVSLTCKGLSRTNFLTSLRGMSDSKGGVPYSTETTNDSFTTSSSVAGTAWLYFANVGFNPFRP